jgi:amino-acid N-acetyltransferase
MMRRRIQPDAEDRVPVTLRKATVADVPSMQKLINHLASQGLMLPRSLHSLYEHIRDYVVAEDDSLVVGCVALHVAWQDLAEVRSLVVADSHRGCGIGSMLVEAAFRSARELGIRRLFVLTFVRDFFATFGFELADKAKMPHKIWQECIECIHFPDCGEEAMTLTLGPEVTLGRQPV